VNPKSGFKTLAAFVAYAKANPRQVNFGSAGTGTTTHLVGELLALSAKIELVHVPYRGAAPGINDLLGGHVRAMFPDISAVVPHVNSGALVALAVTGGERSPQLPNVPTMAEAGYPGVKSETWFGLIAPAATPPDIVKKLNSAALTALKSPDVIAQLDKLGSIPSPMTPEAFRALIVEEQARWKPVIEAAGVKEN
jgi:tripartite-type tricarboxylate transporter receptor subunit TctC